MDYKKLLDAVLSIGSEMLICGAEVNRVEDTLTRICNAYNVSEVNVFTITSSIVITIRVNDDIFTQTKRIRSYETNLDKVDKLNTLSRKICRDKPSLPYILNNLNLIKNGKVYPHFVLCGAYGVIAFSLTVYFGGGFSDGITSGILGMLMYIIILKFNSISANTILLTMLTAFIIGTLAVLSLPIGLGKDLDNIVIGNIMLMIPGVVITNSIRDMINGDTMSGLLRFTEGIIKAVAVALGFVLATVYLGGLIL
ncbi:MAG: threonine/serine exporter family protein [Clostridia bacterium]|nr:threonine/serine exporter family protein [Clostridia bacterium]